MLKHPHLWRPPREPQTQNWKKNFDSELLDLLIGFEHFSSCSSWRVMAKRVPATKRPAWALKAWDPIWNSRDPNRVGRLKRGPLWWRHHTQPTVISTLIKPKIRPPKDTLLRQWHDWRSRRRKCKRVFMIHNFEITESWEDKAGNT